MSNEFRVARIFHRRETEEAGVVTEIVQQARLAHGLWSRADDSAHPDQRLGSPRAGRREFFSGDREDRFEESDI